MKKHLKSIFFDESKMWKIIFGDFEYFLKMIIYILSERELNSHYVDDYPEVPQINEYILTEELKNKFFKEINILAYVAVKKLNKEERLLLII